MKYERAILKFLVKKNSNNEPDSYHYVKDIFKEENKIDKNLLLNSIKSLAGKKYITVDKQVNKKTIKTLFDLGIKLTIDGHSIYNNEFREKLPPKLRRPFVWITAFIVILGAVTSILTFTKKNGKQESVISEGFTKGQESLPIMSGPKIFETSNKLKILITHFQNNKEVASILDQRFRSLLHADDTSQLDIRTLDNVSVPLRKDSIEALVNYNDIDLFVFGSYYPHGSYSNSDTAKIYYKWGTKKTPVGIPQINLAPLGSPVLSMDDIVLGKDQEMYDFIVYFSLARHFIMKDSKIGDALSDKKALSYLLKAQEKKPDRAIAAMIFDYNNIYKLDNTQQYLFTKKHFAKDTFLVSYVEFGQAISNDDTLTAFSLGKKIVWDDKPKQDFVNGYLHYFAQQKLVDLYRKYERYQEAAEIYMRLTLIYPEEESYYINVAEMFGILAKERGITAQINYLVGVLNEHPNFLETKKLLATCYYWSYLDYKEKQNLARAFKALNQARNIYPNIEREFPFDYYRPDVKK